MPWLSARADRLSGSASFTITDKMFAKEPENASRRSHGLARKDDGRKNPLREKFDLCRYFNVIWVVQSPRKKYFAFAVGQISSTSLRILSPKRGGRASSRTRDGMWWTRQRRRATVSQGESLVSDQPARRRTTLFPPSLKLRRTGTKPGEASWRRRVAYGKTVWS